MKILVFSDSHGNEDNMIRAVERERPFTLDAIVHLGDGWRDAEALHRLYPRIPLEQVAGKLKYVDPNGELVQEAKLLGISFGDE